MSTQTTEKIELAAEFVNSTSQHIFLTGKAGTGKTTFLREIAKTTHKNFVIVAPTGVAALNANGVTIHSQFLFPFGSFLPEEVQLGNEPHGNFFNRNKLARRHPLNSVRKQVLRNIDLLIIDEVSMLRADMLDAIDYRLKSVKGNFKQAFGGVQLLMIGDMFQLPPIVKNHEWNVLKNFYAGPHFFESLALKKSGFAYIEFDKIFRQSENDFIEILNNIRNNSCTNENIEKLNSFYRSETEINQLKEHAITLTTHNYLAERLNRQELDKLPGKSYYYNSKIKGDFPEHLYPLPEKLELKVGAKVMFLKNDGEDKRYYNGKLAEVCELSKDQVCVKMEGGNELWLEEYVWENKKYNLHSETKEIEEEIIGTFTQFPIKTAWAITVHKSQGLTFDKAIIDVGQAFAAGQVYVALSRLRSLEGLILRTKISPFGISSDEEIVRFSEEKIQGPPLETSLKTEQTNFLMALLSETFDFSSVLQQVEYCQKKVGMKMEFEDAEMREALNDLQEKLSKESSVTGIFRNQIQRLLNQGNKEKLLERIEKGSTYYLKLLRERNRELLIHLEEVRQLSKTKAYQTALEEIDQVLSKKMEQMQKAAYISDCILDGKKIQKNEELRFSRHKKRKELLEEVAKYIEANPKNFKNKTGKKRKKSTKGETFQITFGMLSEGLNPEEIAEKRGLVLGTIESHLARGIQSGEVDIASFMKTSELNDLQKVFQNNAEAGLGEIFKQTDGKYSYGKLRMAQAWFFRKNQSNSSEVSTQSPSSNLP
ncbi:MAG TPA: helix-turn-helix domain-containing protein [Flavobacteriaceae bacterium]|nr:helix-turn-helix domain-containing protein [Flavobacteriaceae bacterium]